MHSLSFSPLYPQTPHRVVLAATSNRRNGPSSIKSKIPKFSISLARSIKSQFFPLPQRFQPVNMPVVPTSGTRSSPFQVHFGLLHSSHKSFFSIFVFSTVTPESCLLPPASCLLSEHWRCICPFLDIRITRLLTRDGGEILICLLKSLS